MTYSRISARRRNTEGKKILASVNEFNESMNGVKKSSDCSWSQSKNFGIECRIRTHQKFFIAMINLKYL